MEEQNRRPWSDLPNDVSYLIVGRLSFVDRISFHAVCKSWMTSTIYRSSPPPPLNRIPWLMVLDDTDKYTCKLVDPMSKKTYTFDIKSLKKKIKNLNTMKVHESKSGWLLISSQLKTKFSASETLFLYSPFAAAANDENNLIELPTVNYSNSFSYATFSTNPLSEDCLFLTLSPISDKNIICIRTCRRRDHSWTSRNFKCEKYICRSHSNWLYSEGILYYLVIVPADRKMGTLDIARGEWAVLPSPPDTHPGSKYYKIRFNYYKIHMVKLDGELILINGYQGTVTNHQCNYYGDFLRLDLSRMTWESEHFIQWEAESNITCFAGSGYTSVIRICEEEEKKQQQEVYYCCFTIPYPEVPYFMSYLNSPGLELYGSIAEKCCRKLWIDPVVLTFVGNKSEMPVERKSIQDY